MKKLYLKPCMALKYETFKFIFFLNWFIVYDFIFSNPEIVFKSFFNNSKKTSIKKIFFTSKSLFQLLVILTKFQYYVGRTIDEVFFINSFYVRKNLIRRKWIFSVFLFSRINVVWWKISILMTTIKYLRIFMIQHSLYENFLKTFI